MFQNLRKKAVKDLTLPYPVISDPETGLYTFITDNGVTYVCRFRYVNQALSPLLGIYDLEIYDFEFYPIGKHYPRDKFDLRISETIAGIFRRFFTNNLRVLVYLCDAGDGRHEARQNLFSKWYNKHPTDILRFPVEIEIGADIVYGCVLTLHNFPHLDILQRELIGKAGDIILSKFE